MVFAQAAAGHDAIRTLDHKIHRGQIRWIFEADIMSFFDSLDRTKLKKMLEVRIADTSLLRLSENVYVLVYWMVLN